MEPEDVPPETKKPIRKSAPIQVIVHYPTTEEGKRELAKRVASVHADYVNQTLNRMDIPTTQKLALLNAVIADAKREVAAEKRDLAAAKSKESSR